jgi:prepilin-type N-terminal cleavage/methylation domain-containing protein
MYFPGLVKFTSVARRRRPLPLPGRCGGFSLVEALVAMTVLSVGVVGSLAAFSMALRSHARSANYEQAVEIARNELTAAVAATAEGLSPRAGTTGRYHWTVIYSEKPGELVLASVSVRWPEQGQEAGYQVSQVFLPRRP